jgi:hypothetical protein
MKIQIGPNRHGDIFAIIDPPLCWVFRGYVGHCEKCNRSLHLEFIDPQSRGVARCQCEEIGTRELMR